MKWVTKISKEGFYFMRYDQQSQPFIRQFVRSHGELVAVGHSMSPEEYKDYGAEFLGPIEVEHTLNYKK